MVIKDHLSSKKYEKKTTKKKHITQSYNIRALNVYIFRLVHYILLSYAMAIVTEKLNWNFKRKFTKTHSNGITSSFTTYIVNFRISFKCKCLYRKPKLVTTHLAASFFFFFSLFSIFILWLNLKKCTKLLLYKSSYCVRQTFSFLMLSALKAHAYSETMNCKRTTT